LRRFFLLFTFEVGWEPSREEEEEVYGDGELYVNKRQSVKTIESRQHTKH
jgi:hypothetical protein